MAASRRERALKRVGAALVLAGGMSAQACSLVLDVEGEQCASDADCVGLFGRGYECTPERVCIEPMAMNEPDAGMGDGGGSTLPPEWRCIEDDPIVVVPQTNRSFTLSLAVTDFVTSRQPEGLIGRACNPTDVDCSSPVLDMVAPNDNGVLEFEDLPHGWLGFVELEAPKYLPSLVFTNKPYTVDESPPGPTLLTLDSLQKITMGGGEMVLEDRGVVLIAVYDCEGNAAAGVQLVQEMREGEEVEAPYYFEGSLPDRDRPDTIVSRQLRPPHALAVGGFNKVRVGYQNFYGVLRETGQPIGRVSVQVRALTMTIAELHAGY